MGEGKQEEFQEDSGRKKGWVKLPTQTKERKREKERCEERGAIKPKKD